VAVLASTAPARAASVDPAVLEAIKKVKPADYPRYRSRSLAAPATRSSALPFTVAGSAAGTAVARLSPLSGRAEADLPHRAGGPAPADRRRGLPGSAPDHGRARRLPARVVLLQK
jgi:hypothetical protein